MAYTNVKAEMLGAGTNKLYKDFAPFKEKSSDTLDFIFWMVLIPAQRLKKFKPQNLDAGR